MKNPFAYRRTPSPNGEPLHLKKNPFSYTEANRLKVHTVAFSEVLLSRLCRLLLSRMSTPWRVLHRRLVASRQSPSLAQRLLASQWSPTPNQGTSPPGDHYGPGGWYSLQSQDLALLKDPGLAFTSYRTLLHKVFSTQRDSHPSRRRCYEVRDSVSPQHLHSS